MKHESKAWYVKRAREHPELAVSKKILALAAGYSE